MNCPQAVKDRIAEYSKIISKKSQKLADLYAACYSSTIDTALVPKDDGSYFVLTGDIPAMWLRDSTAQVSHYIPLCKDQEVADIIKGVARRQFKYILLDPYANSYNEEPNSQGHTRDFPKP